MSVFCTMLNLYILMLFNTLVYLIWTEISAILFLHKYIWRVKCKQMKTILVEVPWQIDEYLNLIRNCTFVKFVYFRKNYLMLISGEKLYILKYAMPVSHRPDSRKILGSKKNWVLSKKKSNRIDWKSSQCRIPFKIFWCINETKCSDSFVLKYKVHYEVTLLIQSWLTAFDPFL